MNLPVRWLHRTGQLSRGAAAREFARAAADPATAQSARLRELLTRHAATAYGRAHGLAADLTPARFAARVPVLTPTELEPWVARQMAGERGVLTPQAPIYYVRTTGSTGAPKHVPVTPAYRAEYQRALHVSLWHLYRRFPEAFRGRALYFVGSPRDAVAPDGNAIGTMSGFNYGALPAPVRALYAWPGELFTVADLDTRNYLALHLAALADPTFCATILPLTLVLLLRALEADAERLADHVERGALPDTLRLGPGERDLYTRAVARPRPDIARRLRAAAREPAHACAHVFPSLRLVVCWTAATAGLYVPELQRRLGAGVTVRDAVYSAAEGWVTSPMGDAEPGGPVCVTGHYVEFVPEADYDPADPRASGPRALGVHQLDDGARYAILLTTAAGLTRYALGDLVEVCGRFGAVPCLRFVRKAGAHANLAGEKLDEVHVNLAVGGALEAAGLEATWFTLAPRAEAGPVPSYELFVEVAGARLDAPRAAALAADVDRRLGEVASDYRGHRGDRTLGAVAVRVVEGGAAARHRQAQADAGIAVAQLKAAHLVREASLVPDALRAEAGPAVGGA